MQCVVSVFGEQSLKPCALQSNQCFVDPCLLASCPKFPLATCRDYSCGTTCDAEFWYNGQEVTPQCGSDLGADLSSILSPSPKVNTGGTGSNTVNDGGSAGSTNSGCPNGQPMVSCLMSPCSVSACPGVPTATCKDNYCGQCKAEYFLGQQEVTSQCPVQNEQTTVANPQANNNACPNGQQMSNCANRPCAINSCPRLPTAQCRDNYCGGCNAQFFVGQQEVTSQCSQQALTAVGRPLLTSDMSQTQSIGGCPSNQIVRCDYSPCRVSSCANYPQAMCRDVNCGGCYAQFFYNGQEVTSHCRRQQQASFPPWYYWLFGDGMF
ncbi:hypothetical protein V1264_010416 [Littorina saxatilis]|uniref:Uncharacterized protein n=1 Tax=Littorina saxatilis TaxID=31220 RepID=A0AAN9APJ3_9CAEN